MIFQKSLGWVQRFLYNVEQGVLPFPHLNLNIDIDWPLEYKIVKQGYTTSVGTNVVNVYTPDNEHHGLVVLCNVFRVTAGSFPATDTVGLFYNQPAAGASISLIQYATAATFDVIALIGGRGDNLNAAAQGLMGINPFYCPPGSSLQIAHGSVAGGLSAEVDALIVERVKYFPLRLP